MVDGKEQKRTEGGDKGVSSGDGEILKRGLPYGLTFTEHCRRPNNKNQRYDVFQINLSQRTADVPIGVVEAAKGQSATWRYAPRALLV